MSVALGASVAVDAHEATRTVFCKIPNCQREALAEVGPYAGLCDEHKAAQRQKLSEGQRVAQARRRNGNSEVPDLPEPKPLRPAEELAEEGFERKARGLVAVGRRLDQAIKRYRPAKDELDQAIEGWRSVCRALAGEEPSP